MKALFVAILSIITVAAYAQNTEGDFAKLPKIIKSSKAQTAYKKYLSAKTKAEFAIEKAEFALENAKADYVKQLKSAQKSAMKAGKMADYEAIKSYLSGKAADGVGEDEKNKEPKLKFKAPKMSYVYTNKEGQVMSAYRIGPFANDKPKKEILAFISKGSIRNEIDRNKLIKGFANEKGQFIKSGRDAIFFWVFYLKSSKKQTCNIEIVLAHHGKAVVYHDSKVIANIKHQKFENKFFDKIELNRGLNVLLIEYVNTWGGRSVDLRVKGSKIKYGK